MSFIHPANRREREKLGSPVDLAPRKGDVAIIFRQHGHTERYAISWEVTVIKNGRLVGTTNCYDEGELDGMRLAAQEQKAMLIIQRVSRGDHEPDGYRQNESYKLGIIFW